MSIIANNVKSENIIALENIASTQSNQIGQLTDLFVNRNKRSYDQTTRQDVIISFIKLCVTSLFLILFISSSLLSFLT